MKTEAEIEAQADKSVPGKYKVGSLLLALFNAVSGFVFAGGLAGGNISTALGSAVGGAFFWPFLIVLLLNISPRLRSERSRYKIFFWVSFVLCLLNLFRFFAVFVAVAAEAQRQAGLTGI